MPPTIDGLLKNSDAGLSFSLNHRPTSPLSEICGFIQTQLKDSHHSCDLKSLLFHSGKNPACSFLRRRPDDCGWPCLTPEELVCCHVCLETGSNVGKEEPKIFDNQERKERENALWVSSPSLYHSLLQSNFIWSFMSTRNTLKYTEEPWTPLQSIHSVLIQYEQVAYQKSACALTWSLFMCYLCTVTCMSGCVRVWCSTLPVCLGSTEQRDIKWGNVAGHVGKTWGGLDPDLPLTSCCTRTQSQFNAIITEHIRSKPGEKKSTKKDP